MWLTSETVVWMRPSPLRCKATFTLVRFCFKIKTILIILAFPLRFPAFHYLRQMTKWQTGSHSFPMESSAGAAGVPIICRCPFTTESVRYVTIHAHCSIMLHKTINKIYISRLLKTHFKPPSSVCNNFRLPSNVFWPCNVAEICYYLSQNSDHGRENIGRQRWKLLMLISKSVEN